MQELSLRTWDDSLLLRLQLSRFWQWSLGILSELTDLFVSGSWTIGQQEWIGKGRREQEVFFHFRFWQPPSPKSHRTESRLTNSRDSVPSAFRKLGYNKGVKGWRRQTFSNLFQVCFWFPSPAYTLDPLHVRTGPLHRAPFSTEKCNYHTRVYFSMCPKGVLRMRRRRKRTSFLFHRRLSTSLLHRYPHRVWASSADSYQINMTSRFEAPQPLPSLWRKPACEDSKVQLPFSLREVSNDQWPDLWAWLGL